MVMRITFLVTMKTQTPIISMAWVPARLRVLKFRRERRISRATRMMRNFILKGETK
jgi:hypothetical protein